MSGKSQGPYPVADRTLTRDDVATPGVDPAPAARPPFSPPALSELPVVEVDRYAISGEFARGGLGRILEARDNRLDRPVALKELLSNERHSRARFIREALV